MYNIPRTYLSYNWKCVPWTILIHFSQSYPLRLALATTNLLSVSMSWVFVCFYLLSFGCAWVLVGAHSLPAVPGGEGYLLVAVPWLLIALASLIEEHRLWGTRASDVVARRPEGRLKSYGA